MNIGTFDTIVAPATVPGTGAISLIRVSGPETFGIIGKTLALKRPLEGDTRGYTVRYGSIYGKDGKLLDEVLVSIFKAPHSYTGEDSVEISCHASQYIVNEVLMLLAEAGARIAEPGEFTKRAFINGKMDLSQAESVADVIASQDAAAHRVAMNQLKGGISNGLRELREKILEMSSLMELELDFSEEDVEFADRKRLMELVENAYERIDHMVESFRMGNAIRNGVPVAIAGPANAGKSTLLNALCGEDRAIVSDIAGTTRDSIEEVCVINGIRFRFIDTAGIRDTDETIEKLGIERTYRHMEMADIVLVTVDGSLEPESSERSLSEILTRLNDGQKVAVLVNKSDIYGINKNVIDINNFVSSINDQIVCLNISAKDGVGLPELKKWISDSCRDLNKASEDVTTITNQRHLEALVRARTSLLRVRDGLSSGLPSDLVAQDLREVSYHLGTIVGDISTDEVLGNIFRKFCIGK